MTGLDRQLNIEKSVSLTPSEVGGSISLSSDGTFSTPTSLGANDFTQKKELKLFLKNLALKILQETYDEHTKSSSNLH